MHIWILFIERLNFYFDEEKFFTIFRWNRESASEKIKERGDGGKVTERKLEIKREEKRARS